MTFDFVMLFLLCSGLVVVLGAVCQQRYSLGTGRQFPVRSGAWLCRKDLAKNSTNLPQTLNNKVYKDELDLSIPILSAFQQNQSALLPMFINCAI